MYLPCSSQQESASAGQQQPRQHTAKQQRLHAQPSGPPNPGSKCCGHLISRLSWPSERARRSRGRQSSGTFERVAHFSATTPGRVSVPLVQPGDAPAAHDAPSTYFDSTRESTDARTKVRLRGTVRQTCEFSPLFFPQYLFGEPAPNAEDKSRVLILVELL